MAYCSLEVTILGFLLKVDIAPPFLMAALIVSNVIKRIYLRTVMKNMYICLLSSFCSSFYSTEIYSKSLPSRSYNVIGSRLVRLEPKFSPDIFMSSPLYIYNSLFISAHYLADRSRSRPINPTDIYMTSPSYKYYILLSSNQSLGCQEKK